MYSHNHLAEIKRVLQGRVARHARQIAGFALQLQVVEAGKRVEEETQGHQKVLEAEEAQEMEEELEAHKGGLHKHPKQVQVEQIGKDMEAG